MEAEVLFFALCFGLVLLAGSVFAGFYFWLFDSNRIAEEARLREYRAMQQNLNRACNTGYSKAWL